MKVILLAGYRPSDEDAPALGMQTDNDGVTLLDRRIAELRAHGFPVVCVIAGTRADEILRGSTMLAEAELVYDTNNNEATLASNLKAGLAACPGEAVLALPVEIATPPWRVWTYLRQSWRTHLYHEPVAALQIVEGAPSHHGFPLLVTRAGNAQIVKATELRSLADTRLKYLHLRYSEEAALALLEKPL